MTIGTLYPGIPRELAVWYFAPSFLLMNRYDGTDSDLSEITSLLRGCLEHFMNEVYLEKNSTRAELLNLDKWRKNMKRQNILSIILAVVSVVLAVLAYIVLPEQVVVQFSIGSSGNSTLPKLIAVLIPTALGIGGAAATLFTKDNEKTMRKSLIVSVVGIVLCIFMMVVNSLT